MKNLLVDALRQADGKQAPSDEPVQEPGEPVATSVSGRELELLDAEITHDDSTPPAVPDEGPVDAAPEPGLPALELDTDFEDTNEPLAPSASIADRRPAAAKERVDATIAMVSGAGGRLIRWCRWLPALYLVSVAAGAASFVSYQRLSAPTINAKLGSMPARRSSLDASAEPASVWPALSPSADSRRPTAVEPAQLGGTKRPSRSQQTTRSGDVDGRPPPSTAGLQADAPMDPALPDVRAAHEAYRGGDYAGAELLYRRALTRDPHHEYALAGFAAVLERTDRASEAIEVYERILRTDPEDVEAATRLAALVQASARLGAETRLKLLAQRYPSATSIHAALGNLYAAEQRWPEAHEAFVAALAAAPEQADAFYNVAVSAEQLGKHELARQHYAAALRMASASTAFQRHEAEARLAALPHEGLRQ